MPTLFGDRAAELRNALGGGTATMVLALVLGSMLLIAGLRPTEVELSDAGVAYTATCGIETVVAGSSWAALDAACDEAGGLRLVAVAIGTVLVAGVLGQLAWLIWRRSPSEGALRRAMAPLTARLAATGVVLGVLAGIGAAVVGRARRTAGALTGTCTPGSGGCVDNAGLAGSVQVAAVLLVLACTVALLRPLLARRGRVAVIGLVVGAVGLLLALVGFRSERIELGDGADARRITCAAEVVLVGHPQPSVTDACRDAIGSRVAFGLVGVLLAGGGVALVVRGRQYDPGRPILVPMRPEVTS